MKLLWTVYFGYWPCNVLSFHFSSFIDFVLDLIILCFRALAFSKADLSFLFSNSGMGSTSLLKLSAFLVVEYLALDLSCSSTFFVLQIVIESYCCCFKN